MANVHCIASPDDYLLEERLNQVLARLGSELGDIEPEFLPDDVTPHDVAVELCSPSLFSPQRMLVVSEAAAWFDSRSKRSKGRRAASENETVDVSAITRALDEGIPDDVALVVAAQLTARPKGPLAKAVEACGKLEWLPLPPPPKPWEESAVSKEQVDVLRGVVQRAVAGLRLDSGAERLLFDRLGFAPRLLVQEAKKLADAAQGAVVDEDLVRQLVFPKERSLEAARDAILERRTEPLLELLVAAEGGRPVRSFQGQLLDGRSAAYVLVGQSWSIFQQLLYLRQLAARHDLLNEMSPRRTDDGSWYPRKFKRGLAPRLGELIEADAPSPLMRSGARVPAPFALGLLFRAAGRYSDAELVEILAELGALEVSLRGGAAQHAVSAFFSKLAQ